MKNPLLPPQSIHCTWCGGIHLFNEDASDCVRTQEDAERPAFESAMPPDAEAFIRSKMDEVRDSLAAVESTLINGRGANGWRENLADLTDEFHSTVHSVIGLFQLSATPGVELPADIDAEDEARWSHFDRED